MFATFCVCHGGGNIVTIGKPLAPAAYHRWPPGFVTRSGPARCRPGIRPAPALGAVFTDGRPCRGPGTDEDGRSGRVATWAAIGGASARQGPPRRHRPARAERCCRESSPTRRAQSGPRGTERAISADCFGAVVRRQTRARRRGRPQGEGR